MTGFKDFDPMKMEELTEHFANALLWAAWDVLAIGYVVRCWGFSFHRPGFNLCFATICNLIVFSFDFLIHKGKRDMPIHKVIKR